MEDFIAGVCVGVFLAYGARLADKKATFYIERFEKTGKLKSERPIIVEPEDRTQKLIDENFDIQG